MFRLNETHRQQDLFGLKTQLSPELWERLKETKEYAFYEEIFCRIPEADFADLYRRHPASRPNAPINTLVGALILQHLNDWSFEDLLDHLAFDLKARSALGLWSLSEVPFCRATLFNFKNRLCKHMARTGRDKFQVVFDGLTEEVLKRFGLKTGIQRCDSTQIGSNLREYTRVELLVEVALRMWRVLEEADQAAHAERFAPYVAAGSSGQFLHRTRGSDLGAALERLGGLYAWMAEALEAAYGETEVHGIVRRVFAEHFARVEEKVAVRPPEEIRSDSLQSPDDLDATYRKKDGEAYHGYVLHAAETADPENPFQLITDVVVAPNTEEDSRILHERLPEMQRKTPDLRELHTDGAYGSEANDRLQAELGIEAVQTAISGYEAQAPMRIERDAAGGLQVQCPAGHTVAGQRALIHYKAEFAASECAGCPFASVCQGTPRAQGRRTFYFSEADVLRQERHRRIQTLPKERRTLRANVEATIKELKTPCRDGKLRTRGLRAASQYAFLRAIAVNFGRVYRHLRRAAKAAPGGSAPSPGRPAPAAMPVVPPLGRLPLLWRRIRAWATSGTGRISLASATA